MSELPEFCSQSKRTARKRHVCCECDGWIEAGHEYEITSGKWEGEVCSFKTCSPCLKVRDFYVEQDTERDTGNDGAYTFQSLYCDLGDIVCELPSPERIRGYRHLVGMRWRAKARKSELSHT